MGEGRFWHKKAPGADPGKSWEILLTSQACCDTMELHIVGTCDLSHTAHPVQLLYHSMEALSREKHTQTLNGAWCLSLIHI